MDNITVTSVNHPLAVSKYLTAFDFEIIDLPNVVETMSGYTHWIFAICLAYITSIFALQEWMKTKRAYELKYSLVVWNLGLAIFSTIGVSRQAPEALGIWKDFGFHQMVCSPNHHNYAASYWQLMFTLSKFVEFGDTYFLVLRKKPVIFLHWFHHASILFFCWVTFLGEDSGVRRGGLLNYFVHSIMYTYFAFAALNYKFPAGLSKSITFIQIGQFAFTVLLSIYTIVVRSTGYGCSRPWINDICVLGAAVLYLGLFIKFFSGKYKKRKITSPKKLE